MFDEGAVHLERWFEAYHGIRLASPTYACPQCLSAWTREAILGPNPMLTIEDSPPMNQGGGFLRLLTCATCNHRSGSRLDSQLAHRATTLDFAGVGGYGRLRSDLFDVAAGFRVVDGKIEISVRPEKTDPKQVESLASVLDNGAAGRRFTFESRVRFDRSKVAIAQLRHAYLAAFSMFGWSYVMRSDLQPVRDQVADPHPSIIPPSAVVPVSVLEVDPEWKGLCMLLFNEGEPRSLGVVIGRELVHLPHPLSSNPDLYDQLPTHSTRVDFNAPSAPWPKRPSYLLDSRLSATTD